MPFNHRVAVVGIAVIDGAALAAVGPVFRGLDPSDTRTTIRIVNLADYIGSIQVKPR